MLKGLMEPNSPDPTRPIMHHLFPFCVFSPFPFFKAAQLHLLIITWYKPKRKNTKNVKPEKGQANRIRPNMKKAKVKCTCRVSIPYSPVTLGLLQHLIYFLFTPKGLRKSCACVRQMMSFPGFCGIPLWTQQTL